MQGLVRAIHSYSGHRRSGRLDCTSWPLIVQSAVSNVVRLSLVLPDVQPLFYNRAPLDFAVCRKLNMNHFERFIATLIICRHARAQVKP